MTVNIYDIELTNREKIYLKMMRESSNGISSVAPEPASLYALGLAEPVIAEETSYLLTERGAEWLVLFNRLYWARMIDLVSGEFGLPKWKLMPLPDDTWDDVKFLAVLRYALNGPYELSEYVKAFDVTYTFLERLIAEQHLVMDFGGKCDITFKGIDVIRASRAERDAAAKDGE